MVSILVFSLLLTCHLLSICPEVETSYASRLCEGLPPQYSCVRAHFRLGDRPVILSVWQHGTTSNQCISTSLTVSCFMILRSEIARVQCVFSSGAIAGRDNLHAPVHCRRFPLTAPQPFHKHVKRPA